MKLKFTENLREALLIHKKTQKELANYIGTTQQTISRWLKGINEPDLATLLKICEYLEETPNDILLDANDILCIDDTQSQTFTKNKLT